MSVLCVIDPDGRTGRCELMTVLMSDNAIKAYVVVSLVPDEGGKAKDGPAFQGSGTCLRLFTRSCICRMESMIDVCLVRPASRRSTGAGSHS